MNVEKYGKPNPNAAKELSHFAFLIGNWRCDVKVREQQGIWTNLRATWSGRYILDGYVIADKYRMFDANGNLMMPGMNYRSYNAQSKTWRIKWLEALSATWLDLGPEELGGVRIGENSISYQTLFQPNEIHRIKYSNISKDHFLEQSERPEGPWLVDYLEFSELRDLAAARLRRTIKNRSILSPEASVISSTVAEGAAAMEFNGRFFPAPTSEVQEMELAYAQAPERALLLALEASDLHLEKDVTLQGVNHHVVAFSWQGKPFRIFLNAHTALPTATEVISDHPHNIFWGIWGDTATRVYFSTWMIEPGGVRYPRQFDVVRNDLPWKSITITKLFLNPPASMDSLTLSAEVKAAFEKNKTAINDIALGWRGRGPATELAKEVVKISAGWDVALVRQSDGAVDKAMASAATENMTK